MNSSTTHSLICSIFLFGIAITHPLYVHGHNKAWAVKHLSCKAVLSLAAPITPLHLDVFRYVGFERMKVYLPRRRDKRALVSISAWGDSHRRA